VSALPEEELAGLVGFAFHRGVLAAARAPAVPGLEDWWRDLRGAAGSPAGLPTRVVLCPALTDAENLGSIYRCASALGWDAVGMGPECITPYSRRGLRVSMANCLSLPGFRLAADNDFSPLKRLGFVVVGASLHAEARHLAELRQTLAELASVNPPEDPIRLALVFGNEYHGLRPDQEAACDHLVTIPMHRGTDSLNVAVAAGILMFELGKCQD
jgi:tRNA G18 (ribose-2'-O)-methylase SpoU